MTAKRNTAAAESDPEASAALVAKQAKRQLSRAIYGELVTLDCSEVAVGKRHRKEMGDLSALAESIEALGLLQPIGVTPHKELIFGQRRLRACRDILRLPTVRALVLDLRSIVEGEHAENELREALRPSERVGLMQCLREELRQRVGQGARRDLERGGEPVADLPQVEARGKTRDAAAERAGFDSSTTARNAEKVVLKGHADLLAAMDHGDLAISTAARLAELPQAKQRAAVAGGKPAIRDALRNGRSPRFELGPAGDRLFDLVRREIRRWPNEHRKQLAKWLRELATEALGGARERGEL